MYFIFITIVLLRTQFLIYNNENSVPEDIDVDV